MSKRHKRVEENIVTTDKSKINFKPKTKGQYEYLKKIINNTVTFCTGPSGTGKSMVAVAVACQMYLKGEIDNIIVARPTIEASPKGLGFIPGTVNEKIYPYVLPIIIHLKRLLGKEIYEVGVADGTIKFEPLEYLRGRTFDYSFMLLDEAQNCTEEQLILFVTRIGEDSKIVINGDTDQTDLLIDRKITDFEHVIDRVMSNALDNFAWAKLTEEDIVRNPIIKDFLRVMK